ncbi:MAG: class I tRNA ligase family protein [Candidatus Peribacteria bacterium]|jgi:valyl-tRNA synthetase|nr:class I tRNA ligase family protein [Candidatus Peribacteria bacterium]
MDFPKRYKVEYLHQLQDVYQLAHPYSYSLLSLYFLPAVQPLHLGHFYGLYLKDFFLKVRDTQENGVQHGIVFAWKSLLSTNNAKDFFEKKNQNLLQVGTTKLCKYLNAQKVKGTKINKKLLSLYFGNYIESFENHPDFSHYAQAIFRKLWKEGKIHIKKNIAYWSVNLQTTIHPHYISFEPAQGKLYTIKYFIETKNDVLPVTTSVPDLIFGDVALLVHPKDKRYKKLIGKNAIIPIVNRAIPILGDETVDISQHNGIKRVCPCADFESIALAEKHGLAVDHYIFNKDGTYTSYAGEFEGKSRKEFYPNVIRFLEDISNL